MIKSFAPPGWRCVVALLLGVLWLVLAASVDAAETTVRVGILSGEDEDIWRVVAANAGASGLTVQIVTFGDYAIPNEALASHEIDANAFQHGPYLQAQIDARGYKIVPVGWTYVQPIGLYSRKVKVPADLPLGARVGVPNDPSNEGRALLLLQTQGLIKLRAGVGLLPTAADIEDNPKALRVVELDAGIVGRAIDDLAAAVVNTNWAVKSGIRIPEERIAQEAVADNPYRNFIAVEANRAGEPWVKQLVAAYQMENVKAEILSAYKGTTLPAW